MNIEMIRSTLKNIKPGTFTRLTYITELPLKSEFKKQGYKIIKTNSVTTRFNIHYGNIQEVKDKEPSNISTKTSNFSWVDKNNIQYNSNTGKYYLCTYPTKRGRNPSSKYTIYFPDGTCFNDLTEINKDFVINSYWNKTSTNMMKINIDNIIKIGG